MGQARPMPEDLWDGEVEARPKPVRRPAGRARAPLFGPQRGVWIDSPRPTANIPPRRSTIGLIFTAVGLLLGTVWTLVTFPIRATFRLLAFLGRIAVLVVGFCLMVLGASLLPSPLLLIGLPIFALGLVMTLRSVE